MFGQLTKIISRIPQRNCGQPSPKAGSQTAAQPIRDHVLIIIGHPANHVGVRFDVAHTVQLGLEQAPQAALVVAAGIGSCVGSLRLIRTRSARSPGPPFNSSSAFVKALKRKSGLPVDRSSRSRNAARSISLERGFQKIQAE